MSSKEDEEVSHEADSIAAKIAEVLIQAFKGKEGREPTAEELEALFDEVTEERVAEMLNGNSPEEKDEAVDNSSEDEEEDVKDNEEDVKVNEEVDNSNKTLSSDIKLDKTDIPAQDSSDSVIGIKRPLDDDI